MDTCFRFLSSQFAEHNWPFQADNAQILAVTGPKEAEFYDWLLKGDLQLEIVRTSFGNRSTQTMCRFHITQTDPVLARLNNDAFMQIKLAWMCRTDITWRADNFTKCDLLGN
ncbi:hypothetical protein FV233_17830 [Methylobacterium sp. WL7]|nr:hypothetical protein FV233_17830 [Methylobacterium sp. WL7]